MTNKPESEVSREVPPKQWIAVMEDNPGDRILVKEALARDSMAVDLRFFTDGEEAMRLVDEINASGTKSRPGLIILDLNLPKRDGFEVLRHLRNSRRWAGVRVLAVSSSGSDREMTMLEALGVEAVFRKPSDYDQYMRLGEVVKELLEEVVEERAG
jgi:DNA-binding response OmpR family regulator